MVQNWRHLDALSHSAALVDGIGNRSQSRKADEHDERCPHPSVNDHDRPRCQSDVTDHAESRWVGAGEEGDDVIEETDLRLIQEGPKIPDNGGRQHHRQHYDRRPEIVAFEFPVDEPCQPETDQHLKQQCPEQEMRSGLHREPDVAVGKDAFVVAQSNPFDISVGSICPVVRETQADRPCERKDVYCEKQEDRRSDERPCDGAVRQAPNPPRDTLRRGLGNAVHRRLRYRVILGDFPHPQLRVFRSAPMHRRAFHSPPQECAVRPQEAAAPRKIFRACLRLRRPRSSLQLGCQAPPSRCLLPR